MKLAERSYVESTFPDKINKSVYMFHSTCMINLLIQPHAFTLGTNNRTSDVCFVAESELTS